MFLHSIKKEEGVKRVVRQRQLTFDSMEESQENLLKKLEAFEQVLAEVRNVIPKTENNPIKKESTEQDLGQIVESLRSENEVLKRDADQLHVTLADMKASKDYLLEKMKALERELEESQTLLSKKDENLNQAKLTKQFLKKFIDSLQKKNAELTREADQLRSRCDCLKSEMETRVKESEAPIQELKDQLASQKNLHEEEVRSLSANHTAICKELEASKLELEQIRSKNKQIEQRFSVEKVKNLIARVNDLMNKCDVDCAINTLTSYIFNGNVNNNVNLGQVFNKIYRIKEQLIRYDEQLRFNNIKLIKDTYVQLRNIVDYPNLLIYVEKKFLRFCYDRKLSLTAFSLCETIIIDRKCNDAWVYFVYGELFLHKGNYHRARVAFFNSLKFSKEGDSDLQTKYEQAHNALKLEISTNVWTLFNSDGKPLSKNELYSKYFELGMHYAFEKIYAFLKQYKDIVECMRNELTRAYESLVK